VFYEDPIFSSPTDGDFRLAGNSVGIDGGLNSVVDTSHDLFGAVRIQGGTVDMGAFETESDANCLADLDNNGLVNSGDLGILISNYSCTGNCIGDLNDDGLTNSGDLNIMLTEFGTTC
jgi:hypothetical protein